MKGFHWRSVDFPHKGQVIQNPNKRLLVEQLLNQLPVILGAYALMWCYCNNIMKLQVVIFKSPTWDQNILIWLLIHVTIMAVYPMKHVQNFVVVIRDSKSSMSPWVPGTHGPWSLWVPEYWEWVPWLMIFIPPATKLGGVYWIQPVCLSVCPSVRLSVCLSVCMSVR